MTYYQRTDAAAAAALDATYRTGRADGHPGVPQPTADQGLGPHIFDETSCSVGYPEPKDYHFEHPPIESVLDRASPTTLWREAVWEVTAVLARAGLLEKPVDIFGEFIEPLSGDWAAFRACADVWTTVADRIGVDADWIGHGARVLPTVWTGNAATDCTVAVETFVADLRAAGTTIRNLAAAYIEAAELIREYRDLLIIELTALSDATLEAMIPGAPVFEVIGDARSVGKIIGHIRTCMKIISLCWHAVEAFHGATVLVPSDYGVIGEVGPLRLSALAAVHIPGNEVDNGRANARSPQPV